MSIIEPVLKCISNMDIENLSVFLDDKETYEGASKYMFLSKLKEVFNTFKANGDTELIPHTAFCGSGECTNQGCKGYSFFGNISNDYLNLIIVEQDGVLTDFHNCIFMTSENDNWNNIKQLTFSIYADERKNFVPTSKYSIVVQNCEDALNDLNERYNNKLTKEDCFYWLSKNEQLKKITSSYYLYGGYIKKFKDTFDEIKHISSFANQENDAIEALEAFISINSVDETQLLTWLVKNEVFGLDLEIFLYNGNFENNEKIKDGFLPLKNNVEVSLLFCEYSGICRFLSVFCKNYWHYIGLYSCNAEKVHYNEYGIEYYGPPRNSLKEYIEEKNLLLQQKSTLD